MDKARWDARYSGDELIWSAEPNQYLVEEAADLRPGRALDLASGEGRNAIWLARQGWKVTGVDFSDAGMNKARRHSAGLDIEWVIADLADYVPEPGAFDLVIIFYLHVGVETRRAVIERACRAVASGGTLLIAAHHLENLEHGYGGPQDPAILPTEAELASEVRGLEITKADRVLREVDTPEGPKQAIDALVRAERAHSL
ncbi:MAG: class I SAM-dependent methyltransferase [Acidobacteria bacterium]|nr:MAG: class I SAM-dependent methyltransferase [Acidobacteriota bacterium]